MSKFKYKYCVANQHVSHRAFPDARYVYYPFIQVGLVGNKSIKTNALIDTGAQYCFFDKQYAKCLGIDDKRTRYQQNLTGIGGSRSDNVAYFHPLKLLVYKPKKIVGGGKPWEIETMVGFLEKSTIFPAILGEYGFFDYFAFNCVLPESYFELTHLDDLP